MVTSWFIGWTSWTEEETVDWNTVPTIFSPEGRLLVVGGVEDSGGEELIAAIYIYVYMPCILDVFQLIESNQLANNR